MSYTKEQVENALKKTFNKIGKVDWSETYDSGSSFFCGCAEGDLGDRYKTARNEFIELVINELKGERTK